MPWGTGGEREESLTPGPHRVSCRCSKVVCGCMWRMFIDHRDSSLARWGRARLLRSGMFPLLPVVNLSTWESTPFLRQHPLLWEKHTYLLRFRELLWP